MTINNQLEELTNIILNTPPSMGISHEHASRIADNIMKYGWSPNNFNELKMDKAEPLIKYAAKIAKSKIGDPGALDKNGWPRWTWYMQEAREQLKKEK